jgi:predicted nucleic acid-binding protein
VKLLVDTSVWSLALRRRNTASLIPEEQKLKAELVRAIEDGRVAMLGVLRQEVLSGIKEEIQCNKVKAALDPFLDEPVNSADHEFAARVYNECRNQGVEGGTVDILICALAVQRGWEVLSADSGLNRCFAVAKKFHQKQKATADESKVRRSSHK